MKRSDFADRYDRGDLTAAVGALAVVIVALVKAFCTQFLFADGSFFVMKIVDRRTFIFDSGRQFGNFVTQLPAVIALKVFDVHSYHVLTILLGVGFFVIPATLSALAIWVARKDPPVLWFVIVATFLLLTMGYADLGSQFVTYVFVAIAAILLTRDRLHGGYYVAAAVLGVVTFASYQSFVLLGPVLIALVLLRGRRGCTALPAWASVALVVEFAAATAWNLAVLFSGSAAGSSNDLITGATSWKLYSSSEHVHIIVLLVIVAGISIAAWALPKYQVITADNRWWLIGWIMLAVFVAASLMGRSLWLEPEATFYLRGAVAGVVGLLGLATALLSLRPLSETSRQWSLVPLWALLAVALVAASTVAFQWHRFQSQFQSSMSSRTGSVSVTTLKIDESLAQRFEWTWTNGSLGIALSSRQGVVGVRNAPGNDVTFGTLIGAINAYAAHPSIATLPPGLVGYTW